MKEDTPLIKAGVLVQDADPALKTIAKGPEQITLLSRGNLAIACVYFTLGFCLAFPGVGLLQYLRQDLKATPATQTLIGVIQVIPFNLKVFVAFGSDCVPIWGLRRKPYMLVGIIVLSLSWLMLSWITPSLHGLCLLLLSSTAGIVVSDVMADTLVVERIAAEKGSTVGTLQTKVWILRFCGALAGSLLSAFLLQYASFSSQKIFFVQGLLPLAILPSVCCLEDQHVESLTCDTFYEQVGTNLRDTWNTVQDMNFYRPMLFIFFGATLPGTGSAFSNFLLGPLEFSNDELALLGAIGTTASIAGFFVYQRFMLGGSLDLHLLFYSFGVIGCLLSMSTLILIFRVNEKFGLPDFAFAMGDVILGSTLGELVQMPILVMQAKLCPGGVEGTTYAIACMANNIGLSVSSNLSAWLISAFGITLTNFDNLWKLVTLVSLVSLLGLLLVPLVPRRLGDKRAPRPSPKGGAAFLALLGIGLVASVTDALYHLSTS